MPKAKKDVTTLDLFDEAAGLAEKNGRKRNLVRERQRFSELYATDEEFRSKTRDRENSEPYRAYRNAWRRRKRAADPEAARAAAREYIARNAEKRREWDRQWRDKNRERVKMYGRTSHNRHFLRQLLRQARQRAAKKGIEFDLTEDWAKATWDGKCALTGVAFIRSTRRPNALSPSLDRIDNARGYTKDNSRFILWACNRLKGEESDAMMFLVARALIAKADAANNGD